MILTPLPEMLRAYVVWQQVLYGLTFMVFMRFLPDGVMSLSRWASRALPERLGPLSEGAPARERAPDARGDG
jgi:hypothetical protein